jgi:branched-chain amino acid transport system substrate-binding protein
VTGPGSALGELIQRGLELGVEDVNAEWEDRRLEMILEDSQTEPSEGVSAFRKLVNVNGVNVSLVAFSAVCNAVAPVAEESQVLMTGMTTSMPGLPEGRDYVIRLFPNVEMLAGTIADYSKERFSRMAVMYTEDEYGRNTFQTFRDRFQGEGREVVFAESFRPSAEDFRSTVTKMLQSDPDAIYLPGYGSGYIALINQIRERNKEVPILGDSPLSNPPVYRAAGDAVNGVIVPATPMDAGVAKTPQQKEFLKSYRKEYGENPSINILINYDFVQILADAVEATDGSSEAIRNYFINQSPHQGLVGTIRYDSTGESTVQVRPMRIQGGEIVPIDTLTESTAAAQVRPARVTGRRLQ